MSQNLPGIGIAGPGATAGTLTYNGSTIGGPRVTSFLEMNPQRDDADRTIIYNVYRITVSAIITSDPAGQNAGTDETVLNNTAMSNIYALQSSLSMDGGQLIYDPGWGGAGGSLITVNTGSNDRDMAWGPKVLNLKIMPVGRSLAFQVTFAIEFAMIQCVSDRPYGILGNYRSLNYGVVYSIDGKGLTTRTITGHVAIQLNATTPGGASMPFTADDIRPNIVPSPLLGFKREAHSYTLSQDKSRLDFSFVDRELASENAFPPGITDMQAKQTVRGQFPRWSKVFCQLSGSIEVMKGYPTSYGMDRILIFLRERILLAKNENRSLMIMSFDVTEDIFGRTIEFSVTWRFLTGSMQTMVRDANLFAPVQTANMQQWQTSLQGPGAAWDSRGVAQITTNSGNDVIVNPCNQSPGNNFDFGYFSGTFGTSGSLSNTRPPKDTSYGDYRSKAKFRNETQTVTLRQMPPADSTPQDPPASQYPDGMDSAPISAAPQVQQQQSDVIQIVGQTMEVTLEGHGTRIGYPVEVPTGVTYLNGEAACINSESTIVHEVVGAIDDGSLIYQAAWHIVFEVVTTADQLGQSLPDIGDLTVTTSDDPDGLKILGTA